MVVNVASAVHPDDDDGLNLDNKPGDDVVDVVDREFRIPAAVEVNREGPQPEAFHLKRHLRTVDTAADAN